MAMELFEALARHALGDRGQIEPAHDHGAPERTMFNPVAERSDDADSPWGKKRGASSPDLPATEGESGIAIVTPARGEPLERGYEPAPDPLVAPGLTERGPALPNGRPATPLPSPDHTTGDGLSDSVEVSASATPPQFRAAEILRDVGANDQPLTPIQRIAEIAAASAPDRPAPAAGRASLNPQGPPEARIGASRAAQRHRAVDRGIPVTDVRSKLSPPPVAGEASTSKASPQRHFITRGSVLSRPTLGAAALTLAPQTPAAGTIQVSSPAVVQRLQGTATSPAATPPALLSLATDQISRADSRWPAGSVAGNPGALERSDFTAWLSAMRADRPAHEDGRPVTPLAWTSATSRILLSPPAVLQFRGVASFHSPIATAVASPAPVQETQRSDVMQLIDRAGKVPTSLTHVAVPAGIDSALPSQPSPLQGGTPARISAAFSEIASPFGSVADLPDESFLFNASGTVAEGDRHVQSASVKAGTVAFAMPRLAAPSFGSFAIGEGALPSQQVQLNSQWRGATATRSGFVPKNQIADTSIRIYGAGEGKSATTAPQDAQERPLSALLHSEAVISAASRGMDRPSPVAAASLATERPSTAAVEIPLHQTESNPPTIGVRAGRKVQAAVPVQTPAHDRPALQLAAVSSIETQILPAPDQQEAVWATAGAPPVYAQPETDAAAAHGVASRPFVPIQVRGGSGRYVRWPDAQTTTIQLLRRSLPTIVPQSAAAATKDRNPPDHDSPVDPAVFPIPIVTTPDGALARSRTSTATDRGDGSFGFHPAHGFQSPADGSANARPTQVGNVRANVPILQRKSALQVVVQEAVGLVPPLPLPPEVEKDERPAGLNGRSERSSCAELPMTPAPPPLEGASLFAMKPAILARHAADSLGPLVTDDISTSVDWPMPRNGGAQAATVHSQSEAVALPRDGVGLLPDSTLGRTGIAGGSEPSHRQTLDTVRAAELDDVSQPDAGARLRFTVRGANSGKPMRVARVGEMTAAPVDRQMNTPDGVAESSLSAASPAARGLQAMAGTSLSSAVVTQIASTERAKARPEGAPSWPSATTAKTRPLPQVDSRETSTFPAPLIEVMRRSLVKPADFARPGAGGDRQVQREVAERSALPAVVAVPAPPVELTRGIGYTAEPMAVLGRASTAPGTIGSSLAEPNSPAATAARPAPASAPSQFAVKSTDPKPMLGRSKANPAGPMRAAAIASYLDSHMPSTPTSAQPSRFIWQDRAGSARLSREQGANPPAVRVHIGQIRVESAPAAQRPRFSRPRPSLGLADYIERRQGR